MLNTNQETPNQEALVPGWTQGLIVPSLIAPNQECITQPNI